MQCSNIARWMLATVCALLAAPVLSADAPDHSREPVMLVATDRLVDPVYSRTVLIARPIGNQMHVGVILNRKTSSTLAALFPQHEPSKHVEENVFFGGPMSRTAVSCLTQSAPATSEGVVDFGQNLFFVLHVNTIDAIIEKSPNDARYYVGNVVWRPGELDAELERGLWEVLPISPELALRKDVSDLWDELHDDASLVHASLRAPKLASLYSYSLAR
ncbi:MAG TPA: YqgE/AlgH family protein [Burkholderiaceae bacterium]|nr:YqgE/AlgH family protein [Burkholderiaceae bacterium]